MYVTTVTLGNNCQLMKVKYTFWTVFIYFFKLFRFVEHGEYKENLYGTSLEAIRSVMAKKKVCLVDVVPEVSSAVYFKESKCFLLGCQPK